MESPGSTYRRSFTSYTTQNYGSPSLHSATFLITTKLCIPHVLAARVVHLEYEAASLGNMNRGLILHSMNMVHDKYPYSIDWDVRDVAIAAGHSRLTGIFCIEVELPRLNVLGDDECKSSLRIVWFMWSLLKSMTSRERHMYSTLRYITSSKPRCLQSRCQDCMRSCIESISKSLKSPRLGLDCSVLDSAEFSRWLNEERIVVRSRRMSLFHTCP